MLLVLAAGLGLMQIPPPPVASVVEVAVATERAVYGPGADNAPAAAPTAQNVDTSGALALPGVLVEVHDPSAIKELWDNNAWAKDLRGSALGRGFLGRWAPLFGSKAEDLKTALKGALADILLTRVLTKPFQLIWFQGASAQGLPALVMPDAPSSATSVLEALGSVDGADITVASCPPVPDELEDGQDADGGTIVRRKSTFTITTPTGPFKLRAYTIAESTFVAAQDGARLILGGSPGAVVTALCAPLPAMQPRSGVDLDLTLLADNLGREAELLTALLGVQGPLHLGFGVEKDTLAPRGISAALGNVVRLVDGAMGADMVKLIPEDTGITLLMNLKLPARIDGDSLGKALAAGPGADARVRQVAFIFNPSGSRAGVPAAALLWGRVEDAADLSALFGGATALASGTHCNHVILSTTADLLKDLETVCLGKSPSLAHASEPVVGGLQKPHALGVHVQPGRMLWNLTMDGYVRAGRSGELSDEMKAAQQLLEALPFLGFRGRVGDAALTGEGFRS